MPSVNVAMERSLRRGFLDLVAASMRPAVERRDAITNVQGTISDAKTAFSSWDNCMNSVICKWPVIAIIIVGGLMILSVVWCVSRCLCCGLSCCCECCYCLKCCGNCCGCCDPPKGRKHKYLDEPFVPPHHAAYKAHDPMHAGPTPPFARAAAAVPEPPQYAEFDASKKSTAAGGGHEDALPVMPTWESAGSKKVLVEEEALEMDQLKKPAASTGTGAVSSVNGQNVPLMTGVGAVPGPVSPIPSPDHRGPYSPPGAPSAAVGYFGASATDPYTASGRGYNNGDAYGQSVSSLGTDQGYGMAGAAVAGPGRRSPRSYNNAGYGQAGHQEPYQDAYGQDQGYPAARPAPTGYNSYNSGRQGSARQGSYDDYKPQQPAQGYGGRGQGQGQGRRGSPPRGGPMLQPAGSYPQERMGRSPPPRAPEYGPAAARTYSPATVPQRQPTYDMPDQPTANSGGGGDGFDFGTGYSRPQQGMPMRDDGYGGGSRPAQRTQQGGGGYPGYRPYQQQGQGQAQQQQHGWSGL